MTKMMRNGATSKSMVMTCRKSNLFMFFLVVLLCHGAWRELTTIAETSRAMRVEIKTNATATTTTAVTLEEQRSNASAAATTFLVLVNDSNISTATATTTASTGTAAAVLNFTATLCLVVKDPQLRYIDEWADYHLLGLGFTSLHVFDNTETFVLKDWGTNKPYPVHTVHYLPGQTHNITASLSIKPEEAVSVQDFAYGQCVKRAREQNVSWVAAFDVDEFLVLQKHIRTRFTARALSLDDPCAQLSFNWVMCGSMPPRRRYVRVPLARRFPHCQKIPETWVKAVVQPEAVDLYTRSWLHVFPLVAGAEWWDTSGRNMPMQKRWNFMHNHQRPDNVAILYHYQTMSNEEYYDRHCVRGDVNRLPTNCNETPPVLKPPLCSTADEVWQTLLRVAPQAYAQYQNVTDLGES